MDLKKLTIKSARELLDKKETTPEKLRQEFLKAIKKENPELNAYLTVFDSDSDVNVKFQGSMILIMSKARISLRTQYLGTNILKESRL